MLGLVIAKEFKKLELYQNEIQDEFCRLCQINTKLQNIKAKLFCGDFAKIDFKLKFDIIISNPPFYDKEVLKTKNQNKHIARYNDNLPLELFIQKASSLLDYRGRLFFCYDAKQFDKIILVLNIYKLNIQNIKFVHSKSNTNAKLVMIYARLDSKSKTTIEPPAIVFDSFGKQTKYTKDIFNKSSLYSIKGRF